MPGPSKVIVLDPDARAGRQVLLGFEREGVSASLGATDGATVDLADPETGLVVVGGVDGQGLELLRKARQALGDGPRETPIVFAGRGIRRTDAEAAGADEVVLFPAYLRDLVTIGRLLRGQPASQRARLVGSLAETTGVYTLVRALAALGRSAVLTLIRGLRRGEIRFFHGEVTSAQVGLIHGQAAFHQLLLWTEARFEFHHEDIVRRQQIPLSHDELFADAERFLEGVRDSSGGLSPSMVLEQDVTRLQSLGKQIPTEVHGVLRMFDGHRVLADILEDSPYRVFETLRVTQRAVDVGLLRIVDAQRPKATWRAVLAIEEWLVGTDRDAVIERTTAATDSGPVPKPKSSKRKKSKKKRANTPLPLPAVTTGSASSKPDIDWGALVPRVVGAEVGSLSGVVPASHTSGEIELPSRSSSREKLEALMDTGKRERIFPTDIGLEPKVVFDAAQDLAGMERERAEAKALAEAAAKAEATAKAEAEAVEAARLREVAEQAAAAEDAKLRAEAAEWTKQQAEARARAAEDAAREAEELARRLAEAKADADVKADADAKAKADADADADAKAKAKADADAEEARARALAADAEAARQAAATVTALARPATPATPAVEDGASLVRQLLAEQSHEIKTPGITVAETATSTVVVHDTVTVTATATTARLTSIPTVTVTEAAPEQTVDEPSDGIVRQLDAVEVTPLSVPRRPPAGEIPPDDRPEARMGEISTGRTKRTTIEPVPAGEPSILIEDLAAAPAAPVPVAGEPSMLIADLAAAHTAVSAVVAAQAKLSPSPDIASASRELVVAETRQDAVTGFSEAEEEFFRAGVEKTAKPPVVSTDTFSDLDEGYQPVGFWDRLRGKKPPKKK